MDSYLIEIKSDFKNQIEQIKNEILEIETELNKKKEHYLKLQGGLETLAILEGKLINNQD